MSVKTVLVAHRSQSVRDRFAGALADARQEYLPADTASALRDALADDGARVHLALVDLGLLGPDDTTALITELRAAPRPVPVVVFAGSVDSADRLGALSAAGAGGFVNEYADPPQILPALAPHLFPDNFNRRASQRVPISVPIAFRAGQTIAAAQTRDIGRGGVGVQTMAPLPAATPVQVTVTLPGGREEISAFGRITWSDRRIGMGIQFEKLSAAAQLALQQFVERK